MFFPVYYIHINIYIYIYLYNIQEIYIYIYIYIYYIQFHSFYTDINNYVNWPWAALVSGRLCRLIYQSYPMYIFFHFTRQITYSDFR